MKTKDEAMRLANELDAYHTAPHHKQAAMLVRKVQMNAVTATPHAELLAELMNPNNPKNEREHAAVREIERLCEALAQPAQEPVAWRFTGIAGLNRFMTQKKYEAQAAEIKKWYEPFKCANCTTPPAAQPAQEPVEDATMQSLKDLWRSVSDEVGKAAFAQPEREPMCPECKAGVLYECVACSSNNYPPQRPWVDMTDDELADIWYKESLDWMEFARAVLAKSKEKNNG